MMNEREGSRIGLSIVIRVYNEEKTLQEVVRRVRSVDLPLSREIILVDDASRDGRRAIVGSLAGERLRVFYHAVNQGKGAALLTGFNEAQGEIVFIQDADLEYDPSEYPKLLAPILADKADVV
jgi:glycosyltransferase involved in cell wall biosynthesis